MTDTAEAKPDIIKKPFFIMDHTKALEASLGFGSVCFLIYILIS